MRDSIPFCKIDVGNGLNDKWLKIAIFFRYKNDI